MEMNRKKDSRKVGVSSSALWILGMVLVTLGLMGKGILQTRVLGVNTSTTAEVLANMDLEGGMAAATTALVFEALETCAIPIFAVLTVDAFKKSDRFRDCFFPMLAAALVSEIPYNFVLSGQLLAPASKNPVFGLLLGLIALYFYRQYTGMSFAAVMIKTVVFVAAIFWAFSFRITYGVMLVLVITVLWALRDRDVLKNCFGAAICVCGCVANPLYMFAPFGFLAAHFYNEENGKINRLLCYAAYPLVLVLLGVVGVLLF